MPEAESAAWFRCYDWVALDENTRVDIFDLAAMFDSVGFFGSITEEVFKASQRVSYFIPKYSDVVIAQTV